MKPEDDALEEYRMLRSEILYFMNKDTTLLTCLFSGVTAVLFFAVKENIPEGCLLAFLIIIPICGKFAYHRKQMAKISSYMVMILEKKLKINWETNLRKLDEIKKNENKKDVKKLRKFGQFSECPLMACATLASYLYLIWKQWPCLKLDIRFWIISGLMVVLFIESLLLSSKIAKIKDYRKQYDIFWEKLN